MSNSKRKLSLAGSREPFGQVTALEQIPSVLFEILGLSREIDHPKAGQITALTDDLITVALGDPEAWVKMKTLLENEVKNRISRLESENL